MVPMRNDAAIAIVVDEQDANVAMSVYLPKSNWKSTSMEAQKARTRIDSGC